MAASVDVQHLHRLSLDDYHELIESGALDEDTRIELIDGLLVDMSPRTPRHERLVARMNLWLTRNVDAERFEVRPSGALTLVGSGSEPEPDFSVVERGVDEPYHPATAVLVVEVAVSSRRHDLGRKAELYAQAGVREYWVVDVERDRLVVHRDPRGDTWAQVVALDPGATLRAEALELPELDVGELLRAAR